MSSEPSDGGGAADEVGPLGRIEAKALPVGAALLAAAVAVAGLSLVGAGAVAADGSAELETGIATVSENGTAQIDVRTDGADPFEIAIGDEEAAGYVLRATVTPSDGGVTTLVFDHGETGGGGTPLAAEGEAEVDVDRETALGEPIDPAEYDVELFADGDDEVTDIGTLVVDVGNETDDGGEEAESDADGESGDGTESERSAEPRTVTDSDVEAADVVVEPAEAEVSVPVSLGDGETVDLRLRSAGNASTPFVMTEETTVEGGSANATFDLSRATHGDRATLRVMDEEADRLNEFDVLVVDEGVGVERSGDASGVESPGFGVVAAGLALLLASFVARRRT
ncbi:MULTISPECIES: BGTF surface domain-containing protein [Halorubrum]|uniref:Uncharacterized protein n=1 Tax=Halorubrum hochstenium ATCC 700873 TaxID=1227481 RepID=M0FF36_9EURY|nr:MULTISPECIES: BGTF surface domain-containing protein [Halorubrum]ELZ58636.1 hypothetical protein C467_05377 [Halorubrum hochstenium ATCC 700873]